MSTVPETITAGKRAGEAWGARRRALSFGLALHTDVPHTLFEWWAPRKWLVRAPCWKPRYIAYEPAGRGGSGRALLRTISHLRSQAADYRSLNGKPAPKRAASRLYLIHIGGPPFRVHHRAELWAERHLVVWRW